MTRKGWVYLITCVSNNKRYVGSTTNNRGPNARWIRHIWELKNQRHDNNYLQRAWNKYGEINFKFEILEEVTADSILNKEQYYMDMLSPEFNMCRVSGTTLGIKHPPRSEEFRKKMSAAKKGKKVGAPSIETRKKIADAQRSEKSRLFGKKGIDSIAYGNVKPKGFYAKDSTPIVDQNGTLYGSQHEAARILNLNLSHINSVLKGKRKHTGGYSFTYV